METIVNKVWKFTWLRERSVNIARSVGRQYHAVPGARLGGDQRRPVAVLELGPEPADVHAGVLSLGLVAGSPDLAQQHGVAEELARRQGQLAEEGELGRREVDGLAALGHELGVKVDDHGTE